MSTFTGYEPKLVPMSGTMEIPAGSASSTVTGQIVPIDTVDTLGADLSMLLDNNMISLEEFIDEPIVSSGSVPRGIATQLAPAIDVRQISDSSVPKGLALNLGPSVITPLSGFVSVPSQPKDLARENASLRQELDAANFQISDTKITAENYAQQALLESRLKAEQALAYQKGTFDRAHEEYSQLARDICSSETVYC